MTISQIIREGPLSAAGSRALARLRRQRGFIASILDPFARAPHYEIDVHALRAASIGGTSFSSTVFHERTHRERVALLQQLPDGYHASFRLCECKDDVRDDLIFVRRSGRYLFLIGTEVEQLGRHPYEIIRFALDDLGDEAPKYDYSGPIDVSQTVRPGILLVWLTVLLWCLCHLDEIDPPRKEVA